MSIMMSTLISSNIGTVSMALEKMVTMMTWTTGTIMMTWTTRTTMMIGVKTLICTSTALISISAKVLP